MSSLLQPGRPTGRGEDATRRPSILQRGHCGKRTSSSEIVAQGGTSYVVALKAPPSQPADKQRAPPTGRRLLSHTRSSGPMWCPGVSNSSPASKGSQPTISEGPRHDLSCECNCRRWQIKAEEVVLLTHEEACRAQEAQMARGSSETAEQQRRLWEERDHMWKDVEEMMPAEVPKLKQGTMAELCGWEEACHTLEAQLGGAAGRAATGRPCWPGSARSWWSVHATLGSFC